MPQQGPELSTARLACCHQVVQAGACVLPCLHAGARSAAQPSIGDVAAVLRMTHWCVALACVLAGVEWFGRVCVALGVDPPAAFRAWVSSLGPELLKGPFNHQERQLVSNGTELQWAAA